MRPILPAAIFCLALVQAGCADTGTYPSLAPRAVEKLAVEAPGGAPAVAVRDPALAAEVERLLGEARAGEARFAERLAAAQAATKSVDAAGSESWIAAQQALSRLEAAAAPAERAAAALDAALVEAGSDAYAAFRDEAEALGAIVAQQRDRTAEIATRLAE